jgi:4-hydroxymandelate oxidase
MASEDLRGAGDDFTGVSEFAQLQRLGLARMPEPVRVLWEHGLRIGNEAAWQRWVLRPRVLRDVSSCDTSAAVLGQRIELPVIVAPHSLQELCHPDGELATAKGCARAGTFMALPCGATRSPADIGPVGPFWIMLAFFRDRGFIQETVEAAVAAGATALCLTVDYFRSYQDAWPATVQGALRRCMDGLGWRSWGSQEQEGRIGQSVFDANVTWADLEWLRSLSPLPLVIKGIMTAEDAKLAADYGAAAIVVSNHGGQTVVEALPTAEVLPEIVEAVGSKLEVLVDGGIRSGADVFRAVALGARAVMIGRPNLIGLSLGGADGVYHILSLMRSEFEFMMAMTGARTVAAVDRTMLARRR